MNTTTARVTESGTRFRGENEQGFRQFFDTRAEAERFAAGDRTVLSEQAVRFESRNTNVGRTRSRGSRRFRD